MHRYTLGTAIALAVAVTGGTTGLATPPAHSAPAAATTLDSSTRSLPPGAGVAAIAAQAANQQKTTTHNLNLRRGKSAGTKVLVTIPRNTTLVVTSTSGSWSRTSYKGRTGWVASAYLKKAADAKAPAKSTRKRTTYNLNLRRGKSTGTKVLLTIPRNTTLVVTSTSGSWSRTSYKGRTGWVASAYLKNAAAAKPTYRWTTANVNVRKGNSTRHGSLGVVPTNTRVTYVRTSGGWSKAKTSKGTGWISNKYLDKHPQHSVVVYGTLRKGQSAHHILSGRTTKQTKTKLAYYNMYLKPHQTWWSFITPSSSRSRTVVVERMDIKSGHYRSTLANLDKWERFDATKPLADQNYNRKLVTDRDGKISWAYVGGSKISKYLSMHGIRVVSGDYLSRY